MIEYTVTVLDDGRTTWYLNSKTHREDGPAIETDDGYKVWYLNGNKHREDGPAVEWRRGDKWWYVNGKLHREDGPAIYQMDGSNVWFINGEELTEEEFNTRTEVKELTMSELTELVGYPIKIIK